ncbi:hypothetical protein PR202_gb09008 [Eleusine coracana subsp. coracana]|uniref:Uncharacterized protein n=1 Tax=Eleusine coracana subsp. coracana TaxID=191504 RepID=A0AAV5EDM9_ELECO|nr:hypothetical protein PR202_gb09008 [Eleusine coracana subsp. coracana]
MDATSSGTSPVMHFHSIADEQTSNSSPLRTVLERSLRHCYGDGNPGEFALAVSPSIVLHVTCTFFSKPAHFAPDATLSLPELAAFDMCQKRTMFKLMKQEERECLKQQCGGSWKFVLRYILVIEKNGSRVIAGPGHSIVITTNGDVYSFGANCSGQLGLGDTEDRFKPCLIRSLQGIRITQAAVGSKRTMLVSDTGSVYAFGKDNFRGAETLEAADAGEITTPKIVESLKGIFVVQAAIGGFFSAVLTREGRVHTFSWGQAERLGHSSDPSDVEPRLLPGLEDVHVAHISAGNCYLLMLTYKPNGMSVYSLAPWHAAALGEDGRVCTWGWGHTGCLGHGDEITSLVPTIVEGFKQREGCPSLSTGEYTTFVVADNGDVYSFGSGESLNGDLQEDDDEEVTELWTPRLVDSLKALNKTIVQISPTNASYWLNSNLGHSHTSVYSVGCGLGGKLAGTWHAAALGEDGRVCTWGWGHTGCLGHGDEDYKSVPTIVEGLSNVKAVHLSTGEYTTFVVADNGDVYSFGSGESLNGDLQEDDDEEVTELWTPRLVDSLKALNKTIVQISPTNASYWLNSNLGHSHTFAVTESGNLYAFGGGIRGQLGVKLAEGVERLNDPTLVPVDLH